MVAEKRHWPVRTSSAALLYTAASVWQWNETGTQQRHMSWGRLRSERITMETGFQVVVGAALGCQLVPPVILFSPGWLQWMSLQKKRCNVSRGLSLLCQRVGTDRWSTTYFFIVPFPMPRSERKLKQRVLGVAGVPFMRWCGVKHQTYCRRG